MSVNVVGGTHLIFLEKCWEAIGSLWRKREIHQPHWLSIIHHHIWQLCFLSLAHSTHARGGFMWILMSAYSGPPCKITFHVEKFDMYTGMHKDIYQIRIQKQTMSLEKPVRVQQVLNCRFSSAAFGRYNGNIMYFRVCEGIASRVLSGASALTPQPLRSLGKLLGPMHIEGEVEGGEVSIKESADARHPWKIQREPQRRKR